MANNEMISFKQAEVSIRRFNDLAVPQYLGLLKNHCSNIEKSLALGDWNRIKKEQINAMRVIKQVKNLLLEMDELRQKIRPEDLERFDTMMEIGKQKAFDGMKVYLELQLKSPTSQNSYDYDDTLSNRFQQPPDIGSTMGSQQQIPQIRSSFDQEEHQLAQRQACVEELEALQYEILNLSNMFHNMRKIVADQSESVDVIAENAEEALVNVQAGEANLQRALSYKKAMYPIVGALLGTCVGGPIGLVAGLKAGGLAAVGCGILGFTGGSVLKSNPTILHANIQESQIQTDETRLEDVEKREE